jgi:hypothetical protein
MCCTSIVTAPSTLLVVFMQEASTPVVQDKGSSKGQGSLVERDGLYWTAKFMADASSAATASDPHWGLEGGMTPLAAVFASKWRQQVCWALAEKWVPRERPATQAMGCTAAAVHTPCASGVQLAFGECN